MRLVDRVARGDVSAYVSAQGVHELAHRLMTIEACDRFGWPFTGVARRMKRHAAQVAQLTAFRQAVARVPQLGFQVVPVTFQLVEAATTISQASGLMANDSLLLAVMQMLGLTDLASNDSDFDHVPGITRYVLS